MAPSRSKPRPEAGWIAVKTKLAEFDQKGLVGLIHELYTASKDNKTFLHTRFQVGGPSLEPYKQIITRAINPAYSSGSFRISIAAARKAITSYNKSAGDPAGMAELLVFYCEEAATFSNRVGYADGPYFQSLLTVFVQALEVADTLPHGKRSRFMDRLAAVRDLCLDFDYGIGDDIDDYFCQYDNRDRETDSSPT